MAGLGKTHHDFNIEKLENIKSTINKREEREFYKWMSMLIKYLKREKLP